MYYGESRSGEQSRGRVVRVAAETVHQVLGEGLLPGGLELQVAGKHGRVVGHDREPSSESIGLGLVVGGHGSERRPQRIPRRFVGRSAIELIEDPMEPIGVVGQDEVVFGCEVREERAWCEPGPSGDLFDGGLVVSVSFEQLEGDIFEASPPFALVAFS